MNVKKLFSRVILALLCAPVFAGPLYSPTWAFAIDLPAGYELSGGNGIDRFAFEHPQGAYFALVVYHAGDGRHSTHASLGALVQDTQRRLNNSGGAESFMYRGRQAFVIELAFSLFDDSGRANPMSGWAIALELGATAGGASGPPPKLLAMAYGPEDREDLVAFHLSALNSIAAKTQDRLAPGPITEFLYPRHTQITAPIFGLGIYARIFQEDAGAAQALIDREFLLLTRYLAAPNWQEAWRRFYRAIHRDSFYRLSDIALQVERTLNAPGTGSREFAERVLRWVQTFTYERDFEGSDFVNLVSAVTEGRGDCDSRAMLWAMILRQADIPSGIMVSRHYSHAMGLADVPGPGARMEMNGQSFLVAETTARVPIGLIEQELSVIDHWMGIIFE